MQSTRISRQQGPDRQQATKSLEQATGSWNGISVTLRPTPDVDDDIRKAQYRQIAGLDSPTDRKLLSQRTASLDIRSLDLSNESLAKLAKVFGGDAKTTRLAQTYLKYFRGLQEKPKQDGSLSSLLQHYVALHKLNSALKASDNDFVAQMTPQSESIGTLAEFAQKLIDAGEDPEKFQEVLSEVESLPDDSDELHGLMKTLRFKPDQLKQTLREAQQLPELGEEEKRAIQEQLGDVLLQLEIDDGSRIKSARNGIEKGFETSDPEAFVETYTSSLENTGSFLHTFTNLVKRHPTSELKHVIPLMKQTLADELQLDQNERSADKIKLESLINELSYMHISTTLIEKITRLVEGMQRLYGIPAAA